MAPEPLATDRLSDDVWQRILKQKVPVKGTIAQLEKKKPINKLAKELLLKLNRYGRGPVNRKKARDDAYDLIHKQADKILLPLARMRRMVIHLMQTKYNSFVNTGKQVRLPKGVLIDIVYYFQLNALQFLTMTVGLARKCGRVTLKGEDFVFHNQLIKQDDLVKEDPEMPKDKNME